MSTTIYNAYKLKIADLHQLDEFQKNLYKDYYQYILNKYTEKTAELCLNLMELLPYLRAAYTLEDHQISKQLNYPNILIRNNTVIEIAKQITHIEEKENIKAEIAIFPHSNNDNVLLLAFGTYFTEFMSSLPDCYETNYRLTDYHYQNQTDKPHDITQKQWELRRKTWDTAMPSGIPSKDGIIITIGSTDKLEHDLFYIPDRDEYDNNVIERIRQTTLSERLTKYAYEEAKIQYISEKYDDEKPPVSQVIKLDKEFRDSYKKEGSEANTVWNQTHDCISPYMIDFFVLDNLKKLNEPIS